MSSIPAAKERPSGIDAAKEAVLAYATRLGNRSLYARQSVVILAELSRLEEEVATLTRERDGYRTVAVNMSWNHKVRDSLYSTDEAYRAHQEQLVDECLRNLLATLSRQSKEGGE